MSRGLGKNQRLLIDALRAIEAESGSKGHYCAVSRVVRKAYELSPRLQEMERLAIEARKAAKEELRRQAADGDHFASQMLTLGQLIGRRIGYAGRSNERKSPDWLEEHLNPSRVLDALDERGLVQCRRDGYVRLTDAGREMA